LNGSPAPKKDLKAMPDPVQDNVGFALFLAQLGEKHDDAKSGIATPKQDIELVEQRLKAAIEHHQANYDNYPSFN
jgi:phage-related protein